MSAERRMDAYYYSFIKTGCDPVDKLLGAVACAGKSFHHTEDWNESAGQKDDHRGNSPVEWIQNAAQDAADEIEHLRAENLRLRAALAPFAKAGELFHGEPGSAEFDQCIYSPAAGLQYSLCGDDLRRARAALGDQK